MKKNRNIIVIVVDDEQYSIDNIVNRLEKYEGIEVAATATTIEDAIKLIDNVKPDMAFLDIRFPGNDEGAFEIIEKTKHQFDTIIVTGCDLEIIDRLKIAKFDYISKPIDNEDLADILKKYGITSQKENIIKETTADKKDTEGKILIDIVNKGKQATLIVPWKDIVMIKSDEHNINIHLNNQEKHNCAKGITSFYDKHLSQYGKFQRISRSSIINIDYISQIIKQDKRVILKHYEKTPIDVGGNHQGGNYWEDLMKKLQTGL